VNNVRSFHFDSVGSLAASFFVDTHESAVRDIGNMDEWSFNVGIERMNGLQLGTEDGLDYNVYMSEYVDPGNYLLKVPERVILSSFQARQEFNLQRSVDFLHSLGAGDNASDFYLFVKILVEFEKGDESPWFHWLNSMPRLFYNSISMTDFCYECLPPYAASLAVKERVRFEDFEEALLMTDVVSTPAKANSDGLLKWAYNLVTTRSIETPSGDVIIAPMGDMFNHGADPNVELQFDEEGNCYAIATKPISPGSELLVSYGDPSDASRLFAKYGFLDPNSPATFCKMTKFQQTTKMIDIGLDYSRMLFYHETGEISEEVWDVVLYDLLKADRDAQENFYVAHMTGDYQTKQAFHQQYVLQTSTVIKNHVDSFLDQLEALSAKTIAQDINDHPRIPVIREHNQYIRETFLKVKAQIDALVYQTVGNYA